MKYRVMLTVFVSAASPVAAVEAAHLELKARTDVPIGIVQPMQDDLIPIGKPEIVDVLYAGKPGQHRNDGARGAMRVGIHNGRPKESGSMRPAPAPRDMGSMRAPAPNPPPATAQSGRNSVPNPSILGHPEPGPRMGSMGHPPREQVGGGRTSTLSQPARDPGGPAVDVDGSTKALPLGHPPREQVGGG